MIDYACRIIDDLVGGFSRNVSLDVMVSIYFYFDKCRKGICCRDF